MRARARERACEIGALLTCMPGPSPSGTCSCTRTIPLSVSLQTPTPRPSLSVSLLCLDAGTPPPVPLPGVLSPHHSGAQVTSQALPCAAGLQVLEISIVIIEIKAAAWMVKAESAGNGPHVRG